MNGMDIVGTASGPADDGTCPPRLIDNDGRRLVDVLMARLPDADAAIASGYLDLGALLKMDGAWQRSRSLRLLFGGESSMRTARMFSKGLDALTAELDRSIVEARRVDPFLTGAEAVVTALRGGQIAARVHRKTRFHAKATLTRGTALQGTIGSSNLSVPGLTTNTELNVDLDAAQVEALSRWRQPTRPSASGTWWWWGTHPTMGTARTSPRCGDS